MFHFPGKFLLNLTFKIKQSYNADVFKKTIETIFHHTIRKTGYDVVKCKYSKHELEIEQLLKLYQIDTVLDVGANEGKMKKKKKKIKKKK